MTPTCNFPLFSEGQCGDPATFRARLHINTQESVGDYCAEHVDQVREAFSFMGLRPVHRTDGKIREAYIAASGKQFTAAQARTWLIEQGFVEAKVGRLSKAQIAQYAEAH